MNTSKRTGKKAPPLESMQRDPLSAPELADETWATLRQIQIWTDNQVLYCMPGTQHIGRGRKRLYHPWELPIASFAAVLVRFRFPIGLIKSYADIVRGFLHERQPEHHYKVRSQDWYRRAFRGEFPTWIDCFPDQVDGEILIGWEDESRIVELMKTHRADVLVNVKEVISPFVR